MVVPFLFDDFNDNSIDSSKWSTFGDAGIVETSGTLRTPPPANSLRVAYSTQKWDLRKGVLAVQLTNSGTASANIFKYLGVWDPSSNVYSAYGSATGGSMQNGVTTGMGAGTATQLDANGMGPSQANGTWFGYWYVEADKRLSILKSTNNGASWTGVWQYVASGTPALDYRRCGLALGCSNTSGTGVTYVPLWDNVTYFATDALLNTTVRYAGAWVQARPKVRVDGVWKPAILKVRTSGQWNRPK